MINIDTNARIDVYYADSPGSHTAAVMPPDGTGAIFNRVINIITVSRPEKYGAHG